MLIPVSHHSWLSLGLFFALCVPLAACGGGDADDQVEEKPAEPERFPELEPAEPLDLKALAGSDSLGIGAHHGEFVAFSRNSPANLERARAIFSHALYHVQTYDELTQQYGEYTYYNITEGDADKASVFLQDKARGKMDVRVDDLDEEITDAFTATTVDSFAKKSIVIDFFRTNGEWHVRWDGLLDQSINVEGIGPYGLARQDMRDDLLDQIADIAETHTPEYIILGDDLEQLWLKGNSGELEVYKGEWFVFLTFFQEAVARIKAASPNTKVGAGINWDAFVKDVTLEYGKFAVRSSAESSDVVLNEELLDEAYRAIILPLTEWGDVLSLRSYIGPDTDMDWSYQFLRRLPDLYGTDTPVVWYDVGTPTDGSSTAQRQRNYIDAFVQWNAGVNVEAVFWGRLINIDGANGANQMINGRCKSLVEDEDKNFMLDRQRCFDGVFDTIFMPKPALLGFEEKVK